LDIGALYLSCTYKHWA